MLKNKNVSINRHSRTLEHYSVMDTNGSLLATIHFRSWHAGQVISFLIENINEILESREPKSPIYDVICVQKTLFVLDSNSPEHFNGFFVNLHFENSYTGQNKNITIPLLMSSEELKNNTYFTKNNGTIINSIINMLYHDDDSDISDLSSYEYKYEKNRVVFTNYIDIQSLKFSTELAEIFKEMFSVINIDISREKPNIAEVSVSILDTNNKALYIFKDTIDLSNDNVLDDFIKQIILLDKFSLQEPN